MNKIIFVLSLLTLTACGSKIYKYNDYAESCVNKQNQDLAKNISHECLPIDTYEDAIHYHQTYGNEYRKMPDLDMAMDAQNR